MAEFGPDAELQARRQSLEDALRRLGQAGTPLQRFRAPYLAAAEQSAARTRLEEEYAAAAEQAQRAQSHLARGVEQHPATLMASIAEQAPAVRAPELSGYEWWKQNPSLLGATALTQEQRDNNARQLYVLDRVRAHTQAHPSSSPFAIESYHGDGADVLSAAMVDDAHRQMNPAVQELLESPYAYTPEGYTSELEPLTRGQMLTDPLNRVVNAAWSGAGRFPDNFVSGGAALSEGRLGDAAKSLAYAVPNLVSPSFHRGGPGMEGDWRGYVQPSEAAALDLAAQIPFWFTRGGASRRPLPAGERIRQLVDPDSLNAAYRNAARRHHPDVGGTNDAMQFLNAARDRRDLDAILRMSP